MKTPLYPDDPLLQALTKDANELPLEAAAQARSRRQLRATISSGAVVILLALGIFLGRRPAPKHAGHAGVTIVPKPTVVSPEEKKLLDDLGDAPVLVVRNDSGHLRRVYILEGAR
jgi:hypothetical protein